MQTSPLQTLLNNELAEVDAFIDLLEREQTALIQNTLSELIEFAKQKTVRAHTLGIYAKDRKRLFEANGVELSPHAPYEIIRVRNMPEDAFTPLVKGWHKLLQSARKASALNQTNGQLIETRHQQNQQLMMLLQANSPGGTVMSYDAYGHPKLSRRGGLRGTA
ncbi:MAG: flagellar protein FlgN [Burkholderiales bacterium]|nr:flagellar protein FlgN [Burkholderiales bacterium]